MAVNGNAFVQQSDTHDGNAIRNLPAALTGLAVAAHANAITDTARMGSYGVVGDDDFLVAGTGGLNYSIAAGRIVAPGTFASSQGSYVGYNTAGFTASLAAHSAFIRHDLICYRVRDTDVDASGSEDDSFFVAQGISASTDLTLTAAMGSLVVLGRAVVPATSGTPTFTDLRPFVSTVGGMVRCTSATRPTGAARKRGRMEIYEVDTNSRLWWNGSAFRYTYRQLTLYTPSIASGLTLGNGAISGAYVQNDDLVTASGVITVGSTTTFAGAPVVVSAPFARSAAGPQWQGSHFDYDQSTGLGVPGSVEIDSGTPSNINLYSGVSGISYTSTIPFTWAAGDRLSWTIAYPIA